MKTKIIFILLIFLMYSQTGFTQSQTTIAHSLYHNYGGDYFFEDGTYISGGPMDETRGSLVFVEPMDGDLLGIFKPETKHLYTSINSENKKIEFKINGSNEVEGLYWIQRDGKRYAKRMSNHTIKEIKFESGKHWLHGELFLPPGKGPFPLIINVHGSGPVTRHLGPWNTFFLRYGIAILSYDKRGAGESDGNFSTAGYTDFADDVEAAVEFAKQHSLINDNKIGLHGSSEGGWVASMAASKIPNLSFMIIRAGPGVSGSDAYMHEVKIEYLEKGLTNMEYVQAIRFERTIKDMAADDKSLEEVNTYIMATRENNTWFPKAFGDYNEMSPDYLIKLKKSGPIDPVDYLRRINNIPVLWFLAENDENVPYELSKPRIPDALEEAGNDDYQLITIPNVKHNFIVETPDGDIKFADGYWDKMLEWLETHNIAKLDTENKLNTIPNIE